MKMSMLQEATARLHSTKQRVVQPVTRRDGSITAVIKLLYKSGIEGQTLHCPHLNTVALR